MHDSEEEGYWEAVDHGADYSREMVVMILQEMFGLMLIVHFDPDQKAEGKDCDNK